MSDSLIIGGAAASVVDVLHGMHDGQAWQGLPAPSQSIERIKLGLGQFYRSRKDSIDTKTALKLDDAALRTWLDQSVPWDKPIAHKTQVLVSTVPQAMHHEHRKVSSSSTTCR